MAMLLPFVSPGRAAELNQCVNGPVCVYTDEAAFQRDIDALDYPTFRESFENSLIWGPSRDPQSVTSVTSMGITWTSNHPDAVIEPVNVRTGSGPARTGSWGLYSWPHGDPAIAVSPVECDVDNPPAACRMHDGFMGSLTSDTATLFGAGGWITGTAGGKIIIYLDGNEADPVDFDESEILIGSGHQFFGVIDMRGFNRFEYRETEGKRGDEKYIFADDFTFSRSLLPSTTTAIAPTTTTTMPVQQTTTTSTDATPCLSEVLYGQYSEETEMLRYLRDAILNQTPQGREMVRLYYQWNPLLVQAVENDVEFKEEMRGIIDGIVLLIQEEFP